MRPESAFYLSNILITTVFAIILTYYWVRREHNLVVRAWMVSAWVLVAADVLFVIRPGLPPALARTLPTILVTVGQGVLLLAAQRTADMEPHKGKVRLIVALHLVALVTFLALDATHSHLRTALNGLVWGGLSYASAHYLRRGAPAFWQSVIAPATVFIVHAAFHAVRAGLAITFEVRGEADAIGILSIIGDLEVAFFVVALYGSLLVADLITRNEALQEALGDVRTLSGLLPVCAWCSRIRDDEGYWSRVDDYLSSHSGARDTHSICTDCASLEVRELEETARQRGLGRVTP
jgi:hypothetical protein